MTDESGAIVPGAKVTLAGPEGLSKTTTAANDGSYSFADLQPGDYTVQASAPSLILLRPATISLKAGTQTQNLLLNVVAEKEQVTVAENSGPTVSTEAANNASAMVLRGTDLDALSDNPDDLTADLQALAGPAAGPNGGTIYIDGFSGGDMPPKNAIREIRINQNPFSPEYDKLGFGRIEIFTKPGADKFRGSVGYNFANDATNSRNAYAAQKAPFHLNELSGTLSGPIKRRLIRSRPPPQVPERHSRRWTTIIRNMAWAQALMPSGLERQSPILPRRTSFRTRCSHPYCTRIPAISGGARSSAFGTAWVTH